MNKIIQLCQWGGMPTALCEDGSVWQRHEWQQYHGDPQCGMYRRRYKWKKVRPPRSREVAKPPIPPKFADDAPIAGVGRVEAIKHLRNNANSNWTLDECLQAVRESTTFREAKEHLHKQRGYLPYGT